MALTWGSPEYGQLVALCGVYLRVPTWDDATDSLVFDPPLTTDEQAVYARLQRAVRSAVQGITPDEWLALEPKLAELRTLRTRTAAEWQALTAAQRDNALIQWCQDITDVLRAMLRN